ncbi:hypothetical protein [Mangrovibrevibacter kandeliae]|uniref:hypothetical protein n=1 Tax=Mangrovibrevibacter kandeliae TaxID=2968473 RepID=UPI002118B0CE|nr:hypothetical protein [Aurantimonas sp. CSK15Z-1]MCQ8781825.1 hypothetical protein [Aurantimonas sp. CSK15Z-1]
MKIAIDIALLAGLAAAALPAAAGATPLNPASDRYAQAFRDATHALIEDVKDEEISEDITVRPSKAPGAGHREKATTPERGGSRPSLSDDDML